MKEVKSRFDENLAKKIKTELFDHTERYEDGAWEVFLARKKKKRKWVVYWYLTGIASSIALIMTMSILLSKKNITPQIKNKNQILDKEAPFSKIPSLENVLKDSLKNLEIGKIEKKSITVTKTKSPIEPEKSPNKPLIYDAVKYDSLPRTKLAGIAPKEKQVMDSASTLQNKKNQLLVSTDSISERKLDLLTITNELKSVDEDEDESKLVGKKNSKLLIGLLVSPSFGTDRSNTQSMASSNIGAGVLINIPIVSSKFSIDTGAIFNVLNASNEDLLVLTEGGSGSRTTNLETNQLNIDIPLNIVYTIPNKKENLFVMAGVSSYITLKENQEMKTTATREIEVFQEIEGNVEVTTITESVITTESSKEKTGKFLPLGAINLSIGYRAKLSDRLKYEIQPFYKYPLKSLTVDNLKVPTAGIALRLIFSE